MKTLYDDHLDKNLFLTPLIVIITNSNPSVHEGIYEWCIDKEIWNLPVSRFAVVHNLSSEKQLPPLLKEGFEQLKQSFPKGGLFLPPRPEKEFRVERESVQTQLQKVDLLSTLVE